VALHEHRKINMPANLHPSTSTSLAVHIPGPKGVLNGDLVLPAHVRGVVLFAHGSGSSRHSPRNRFVARTLQEVGLATLLMDLLSDQEEIEEDAGAMLRFDVQGLATRLSRATDWLGDVPETRGLRVGYFGASTGAAAALIAAASHPQRVAAVVSRGGRPDLAGAKVLRQVQAPTLLLVGSHDEEVLEWNRQAYAQLRGQHVLSVIPGATHLFEEPGTLEQVAVQARDWFVRHLASES
jgi:putative phosphoribosyl transferase